MAGALLFIVYLSAGGDPEFEELTRAIDHLIPALGEYTELLIGLFLWTVPAQFLVGFLPQEAPLLYASQFYDPFTITATVLSALLLAELANYHTIKAIGTLPQINRVLQNRNARKIIDWFNKAPFQATVVAAFTPIPFFPIRLLAPLGNYPLPKYIGAVALGRAPRIFILAMLGVSVSFPTWFLILIAIIPLGIIAWKLFVSHKKNSVLEAQTAILKKLPPLITIPNLMTASRVLIFLPMTVYGLSHDYFHLAFYGIILIGLMDLFDGIVARALKQTTEMGKFFDYASDILCWLVVGFVLAFTTDLPIGFVYFLLVREILHITFAGILSGKGITTKSSRVATIAGSFTVATFLMYLLHLPYAEYILAFTILLMINGTVHYFRTYAPVLKDIDKKNIIKK
jgi:phosphatidylglycerophosphate synthase/membrane protein DedA with SNARE-associated domain